MEKGYYYGNVTNKTTLLIVAIHNKNGKGLLPPNEVLAIFRAAKESQSTIKMEKGYYFYCNSFCRKRIAKVAIHNKNGKGLLH